MRIRIDEDGTDRIIRAGLEAVGMFSEDAISKFRIVAYRIVDRNTGRESVGITLEERPPNLEDIMK